MRVLVLSSKTCWPAATGGYATDGGFAFQMRALSELFDETVLALPCESDSVGRSGTLLSGNSLSVVPLSPRPRRRRGHVARLPIWLATNWRTVSAEIRRCDAVHAPIPGDLGTLGMLAAVARRKPLFVRHCGNWNEPSTVARRAARLVMEQLAGGRNVMLATGGATVPPSSRNDSIRWIFATSMTDREMQATAPRTRRRSGQSVRLITVCRQIEEKGTGVLIESLPSLAECYPNVEVDVVGDGEALPRFRQRAEELGVGRKVHFHGNVDHEHVMRLLDRADLFCLPTWSSEGFPKAVLEALACGLPVLTTRVSVLPQLIGAGCGVLLDAPTPEEVARAVRSCLEDEDRYAAMSHVAVRTARAFSLERWRDTIGEMLTNAWGPLRSEAANV